MSIIISGTGHRPKSLGGFEIPNPIYNKVCQATESILLQLKPDKVISGGALGFDQYLAHVTLKLGIPLTIAVPFIGQELNWAPHSQKLYHLLCKQATIVIVSEGSYYPSKMQIRNQYLVDNCDILLACFNGSAGGTANCINYAKSLNKKIIYINPNIL